MSLKLKLQKSHALFEGTLPGKLCLDELHFYWDRPEANLNIRLPHLLTPLLIRLAKRGVQVFIAIHSLFHFRELYIVHQNETLSGDVSPFGRRFLTFEERSRAKEPLAQEIANKARDSLTGLFAAQCDADRTERSFARCATVASKVKVALHPLLPTSTRRGYSRLLNAADVQSKLMKCINVIDPDPLVVDSKSKDRIPWFSKWQPEGESE